jgi:hypothetical protein
VIKNTIKITPKNGLDEELKEDIYSDAGFGSSQGFNRKPKGIETPR